MFTRQSYRKMEFSASRENICIDLNQLNIKTTATIAAISMQNGLIYWKNYPKSINTDRFLEWLNILQYRTGKQKIALFLDNLRVHHTKRVKQWCADHKIPLIFNVPYWPGKCHRHLKFYRRQPN